MDKDLHSIQQARTLLRQSRAAFDAYHHFSQEKVDRIVRDMVRAGVEASERLAKMALEETGFGRLESKIQKNLFATRTLSERMAGMKTCGIINTTENDSIWEIAAPMGVVAGLVPSTNPTSTAMYKAIIAAKARCGMVLSPHPRAKKSTLEALRVVATAAYRAGAPEGLFGCMSDPSIEGTNALLEDPDTDLILATGGSAMVKAAYSKGKPAYGVGSGNVPVYVDRSADLNKAAADIMYGVSFDWGTLCSTERSIVADTPSLPRLKKALIAEGAYFVEDEHKEALRQAVAPDGRLNIKQVGQSPAKIAALAGFSVPEGTRGLIVEVSQVGKEEPLSMETLSPILSLYTADGWEAGCARCKEILAFGGIGHTLALHAGTEKVIKAFALEKPAMRIVVNSVAALGSVGYTTALFPAMTLGPGTIGGSITSDNISPLHLVNIKRVAMEVNPVNPGKKKIDATPVRTPVPTRTTSPLSLDGRPSNPWMDEIDARIRMKAGNQPSGPKNRRPLPAKAAAPKPEPTPNKKPDLSNAEIDRIASRFRKK
ncbi:MAG: aldehyde dehydrogenase family protein [Bacteroidetes Order II. Incertae sedis bacterium]|jgi:acetaldehyde dehydrogenase (acetylating)|nr:aldehyde dehydrogenase family protein [Bacteroidetes Order II. bacterium]MBT7401662.1 aldehyde dehydrogenase family protein [Bacteroidetes Order II. bacterium]